MFSTLAFITTQNAPIIMFITGYIIVMILVYNIVLHTDRKRAMKAFSEWLFTYDERTGIK